MIIVVLRPFNPRALPVHINKVIGIIGERLLLLHHPEMALQEETIIVHNIGIIASIILLLVLQETSTVPATPGILQTMVKVGSSLLLQHLQEMVEEMSTVPLYILLDMSRLHTTKTMMVIAILPPTKANVKIPEHRYHQD